ncbi:MAG: tRNA preQ1(34) S-adenosylmethionine ribosyltransferase-isomerase QueA [Sphaerochaetaceae bacterium]|nr:tRNA preQ1(34) S-adenosylmethionine ribosyltransferase-isomerase QueA [Sphaerochaetaceae bacterium]
MKISQFTFDLPAELIAQTPADRRGNDRLLVIDRRTGEFCDSMFYNFADFVEPGSLLVINDTKVRKARVFGISETGGKVEFLFTGEQQPSVWQAMVSRSKKQKPGKSYVFYSPDGKEYCRAQIVADVDDSDGGSNLKSVKFDRPVGEDFFTVCGHVPLPPYIKREDDFNDDKRYQTIYADKCGSMASPTAGLHFTEEIFTELSEKNVEIVRVTLEVGMGTFLPVRTENLEDHVMHTETYRVSADAAERINRTKKEGRKIVATGTTSIRTLESAGKSGTVIAQDSSTNLFITPGFDFKIADQLLTNFHTPESTLLVLVSAFAGREHVLDAYRHAVEQKYRFFSYGDACFFV